MKENSYIGQRLETAETEERLCNVPLVELGFLRVLFLYNEVRIISGRTGKYIQCEYCGKTVYKTLSQYNKRQHHFCSNKCQSLLKRQQTFEYRNCEICGKTFYVSKKSSQRFCSCDCQHEWQLGNTGFNNPRFQGGNIKCDYCGKEYTVGKYVLEKSGRHFCSTQCRQQWYSSVWSKSDDWREESRKRAVCILNNNTPTTQTKPQVALNNLLDEMNIHYRNEESFIYYSIDNYLPDYNLAIEVMGDYWHSLPLKYSDVDSVNDKQKHIISRDKAKRTYLKEYYGISILYIWESDILKRRDVCSKLVEKYISGVNLPNYHSFNYSIDNGELIMNEDIICAYQDRPIAC